VRAEWLHTCDERAAIVAHRGFHEDDIHADLARMKTPAALIAGGRGNVISDEEEREIAALAPLLHVRRLATAGHQMQVDDFDGFLKLLGEVLEARL
jgi:N-formylmaleamate deformylase